MEIEDGNDVLAKLDEVIENSKTWLEELGFYNRDGAEYDKEYTSNLFVETYKRVEDVRSTYQDVLVYFNNSKEAIDSMFTAMDVEDNTQRITFALTWTFLQKGMGLNNEQTIGMMVNMNTK